MKVRGLGKKTLELQQLRHRVRQLELENRALRAVAMSSEDTRGEALRLASPWLQSHRPKQVKNYSKEFKLAVLERAEAIGMSAALRESGVSQGSYYSWKRELKIPMFLHSTDKTL